MSEDVSREADVEVAAVAAAVAEVAVGVAVAVVRPSTMASREVGTDSARRIPLDMIEVNATGAATTTATE